MILPLLLGVELIYASFIPTKQVYLQQFLKNKKIKTENWNTGFHVGFK